MLSVKLTILEMITLKTYSKGTYHFCLHLSIYQSLKQHRKF